MDDPLFWFPESLSPVGIPVTFSFSEQEQLYGLRYVNRSFWSSCTRDDIRYSFNHVSKDANGKKPDVPEKFIDVFEDLLRHINFLPPRVPFTIVRNWHVPRFDLTRADQEYKTLAELTLDLPFRYGSLTDMFTSFRAWIGSDRLPTFQVPGLEFVTSTGKDIFKLEW